MYMVGQVEGAPERRLVLLFIPAPRFCRARAARGCGKHTYACVCVCMCMCDVSCFVACELRCSYPHLCPNKLIIQTSLCTCACMCNMMRRLRPLSGQSRRCVSEFGARGKRNLHKLVKLLLPICSVSS